MVTQDSHADSCLIGILSLVPFTHETPDSAATEAPLSYRHSIMCLAAVVLLTAGCDLGILGVGSSGHGAPEEITELPRALTASEVRVLDASNAFAVDLLGEVVEARPEESHLVSPLSASMALGMALNGAAGETFEAMHGTLRFEGLSEAEINTSVEGLMNLLEDLDPQVSFEVANSVWYQQDLSLRTSFRETVEGPYEAQVEGVDFRDPATPGVLNEWVDDRTRGRIPEIVPDPLPQAGQVVMYLLNAMYFQGDWRNGFDPAQTVEGDFHLPDGSTATARFMTDERTVDHASGGSYQVVDIPYGGKAFSMTVVVPREGHSIADVLATLRDRGWNDLIQDLGPRNDVELRLPRFTFEWEDELNGPLEALGMGIAFSGAADFSRLFEDLGPAMSEVHHSTFIRVDEEGTEAAAATAVDFRVSGNPVVHADRPFLYAIRERLSGTILLLGVMMEPSVG